MYRGIPLGCVGYLRGARIPQLSSIAFIDPLDGGAGPAQGGALSGAPKFGSTSFIILLLLAPTYLCALRPPEIRKSIYICAVANIDFRFRVALRAHMRCSSHALRDSIIEPAPSLRVPIARRCCRYGLRPLGLSCPAACGRAHTPVHNVRCRAGKRLLSSAHSQPDSARLRRSLRSRRGRCLRVPSSACRATLGSSVLVRRPRPPYGRAGAPPRGRRWGLRLLLPCVAFGVSGCGLPL